MTSSASSLRDPDAGPAPHLGADRRRRAAGVLRSYPHLTTCAACSVYVMAALDELDISSHGAHAPAVLTPPAVPLVRPTVMPMVTLVGLVAPWVLSFHESSHRSDPRRTALEHFGL